MHLELGKERRVRDTKAKATNKRVSYCKQTSSKVVWVLIMNGVEGSSQILFYLTRTEFRSGVSHNLKSQNPALFSGYRGPSVQWNWRGSAGEGRNGFWILCRRQAWWINCCVALSVTDPCGMGSCSFRAAVGASEQLFCCSVVETEKLFNMWRNHLCQALQLWWRIGPLRLLFLLFIG